MNADSEQDALLAAIFAAPEDDTLRLIYADWLDEHGEPEQAAFIRIQIECGKQTDSKVRKRLERRETEAWRKLKKKWSDLFAAPVHFRQKSFQRGFVFGSVEGFCTLSVEQYIARSADWWPRLAIREVNLRCEGAISDVFFNCTHLRRLAAILVDNGRRQDEVLPEEFVVRLFSCDAFERLNRLTAGRVPLSRPVIDALRSAPYLRRLQVLGVVYLVSKSPGTVNRGSLNFTTHVASVAPGGAVDMLARKLPALEEYLVVVPRGETSCSEIADYTRLARAG